MKHKVTKATKAISILLAGSLLLTSCASTTMIQSSPNGAKLYLDGESAGQTPYSLTDTKIVGSCTSVKLEKTGYKTFYANICKNEEADIGAIIGGIFFLFPFLWTMKYKPFHRYDLIPITNSQQKQQYLNIKSKMEKLRELKQMFDQGILTQKEYIKAKNKVLEEKK